MVIHSSLISSFESSWVGWGDGWVVGKGAERVLPEGSPQGYSNMLAGTHPLWWPHTAISYSHQALWNPVLWNPALWYHALW